MNQGWGRFNDDEDAVVVAVAEPIEGHAALKRPPYCVSNSKAPNAAVPIKIIKVGRLRREGCLYGSNLRTFRPSGLKNLLSSAWIASRRFLVLPMYSWRLMST